MFQFLIPLAKAAYAASQTKVGKAVVSHAVSQSGKDASAAEQWEATAQARRRGGDGGGVWEGSSHRPESRSMVAREADPPMTGRNRRSMDGRESDLWDDPKLPHFAKGGIVTKPTKAILGESGPEMVVPLGRDFNPDLYGPPGERNPSRHRDILESQYGVSDPEVDDLDREHDKYDPAPSRPSRYDSAGPSSDMDLPSPKRKGFWEHAAGILGDNPLVGDSDVSDNPLLNALVVAAQLGAKHYATKANDAVAGREDQFTKVKKRWDDEDSQYKRDVESWRQRRVAARGTTARRRVEDKKWESTHTELPDGKWAPVRNPSNKKDKAPPEPSAQIGTSIEDDAEREYKAALDAYRKDYWWKASGNNPSVFGATSKNELPNEEMAKAEATPAVKRAKRRYGLSRLTRMYRSARTMQDIDAANAESYRLGTDDEPEANASAQEAVNRIRQR